MQRILRFAGSLLLSGFLVLLIVGLWQRQAIADWVRLRDYTPPAEIAEIAENIALTDYGQKLLYVHHPQLEDRESFNDSCDGSEQTIVLGCYKTHDSIHVFNVTDPKLSGIREVTAAHEMLHAGYDRLDNSEKMKVDQMTVTYYDKIKSDNQRLRDVIKSYTDRDFSVVNNELHSILATEIKDLPDELEDYYSRYFTDRQVVVGYAQQYETVFTRQQERIKSLDEQIARLQEQLIQDKTQIDQTEAALSEESRRLSDLRNQNDIDAYNQRVPEYNRRVGAYRGQIAAYNAGVNRLNELIDSYNDLAVEQKDLINAIDSRRPEL